MGIKVNEISGGVDSSVIKIKLNDMGDYTTISVDDDSFFDKLAEMYSNISEKADKFDSEMTELEKKKSESENDSTEITIDAIRKKREFSEEVAKAVDSIFGDGTVKKLFRSVYEEIPDFVPSAESIITFLENVKPEMEKAFGREFEEREKASKARMAK